MALMENGAGDPPPPPLDPEHRKALPDDPDAIARRLRVLCRESACNLADQIELLVRFDDRKGWMKSGARHCVAWMNAELGIGIQLGFEYLRAGRKLRGLPVTRALFRAGRLSWSIIRAITRVATPDNERLLCHSALDASVSEVERLCAAYRWNASRKNGVSDDGEGNGDGSTAQDDERQLALQQFNARSFTWRLASNGNTEFRLSLPPDLAEAFLNGIEHALSGLGRDPAASDTMAERTADASADASADTSAGSSADIPTDSMPQRRADAAVQMAENSLQSAGRDCATADRYQVIVNVDAAELGTGRGGDDSGTHSRRPSIDGHTPIARDTVRRHACDCSVSTLAFSTDGEPVDIGRKSRIWPTAMARAIKVRDRHCQFPGCTVTRHLQIHHIEHWADGGYTCVDNGVCLCARHHTLVHEGGYRIERVSDVQYGLDEQFTRQRYAPPDAIELETALRNSRESFDAVRRYAPERFRFRIVDAHGTDVRDSGALATPSFNTTAVAPSTSPCQGSPAR